MIHTTLLTKLASGGAINGWLPTDDAILITWLTLLQAVEIDNDHTTHNIKATAARVSMHRLFYLSLNIIGLLELNSL